MSNVATKQLKSRYESIISAKNAGSLNSIDYTTPISGIQKSRTIPDNLEGIFSFDAEMVEKLNTQVNKTREQSQNVAEYTINRFNKNVETLILLSMN